MRYGKLDATQEEIERLIHGGAEPTPQPTPMVTPDPVQSENVDKNSSKNDIRAVQRKLIFLGLMESGSDDGVYGTTTTAAVKKFQQRVNQIEGFEIIEVSGVVDPLTMAYLNFYVADWEDKLKATPTPANSRKGYSLSTLRGLTTAAAAGSFSLHS